MIMLRCLDKILITCIVFLALSSNTSFACEDYYSAKYVGLIIESDQTGKYDASISELIIDDEKDIISQDITLEFPFDDCSDKQSKFCISSALFTLYIPAKLDNKEWRYNAYKYKLLNNTEIAEEDSLYIEVRDILNNEIAGVFVFSPNEGLKRVILFQLGINDELIQVVYVRQYN